MLLHDKDIFQLAEKLNVACLAPVLNLKKLALASLLLEQMHNGIWVHIPNCDRI